SVAACSGPGALTAYPGSPVLARAFLRAQDRLIACELEPSAAAALARNLAGDRRSKAVTIDGWTALNAYVPPKERRGLVLVDPAYEQAGDFARLAQALAAAHRKWTSGTYLVWYPIKERTAPDALARRGRPACAQGGGENLARPTSAPARRAGGGGSLRAGSSSSPRRGRSPASLRRCCRSLRLSSPGQAAAPTASIGSPAKASFTT